MEDNQHKSDASRDSLPTVIWEQPLQASPVNAPATDSKVISLDIHRQQHRSPAQEAEAVVISRNLYSTPAGQPIPLTIISSGFGQKVSTIRSSLQIKAAA
ncbi:hypothetical protein [Paenibacillus hexagrammi]|uniref:Uncharacterized protein n=1 Tax=Paenibacillus hexagrammi TaxID=2908839 RepID=A0ABY3SEY7_9BACL|nr:hypothetical protein [Paenibacillus sp. YPD9-1]UJF31482.1 hypothetical protein L0M14_16830 [Paenibacillus sp. YPD9-1]